MNKINIKKLTKFIFIIASLLSVGMVYAVPKVTLTITSPAGSSGADSNTSKIYKGIPWLPCVSTTSDFGSVTKIKPTAVIDQLKFDITATNEDVGKDGTYDYDLYVVFINQGAKSGTASNKQFYFLTAPTGFAGPSLTAYTDDSALINTVYVPASKFASSAFSATIFGASITLDDPNALLTQGMWSILAVMADPLAVSSGQTFQDPKNWETWTVQSFILGTPFATKLGTTGTGICL